MNIRLFLFFCSPQLDTLQLYSYDSVVYGCVHAAVTGSASVCLTLHFVVLLSQFDVEWLKYKLILYPICLHGYPAPIPHSWSSPAGREVKEHSFPEEERFYFSLRNQHCDVSVLTSAMFRPPAFSPNTSTARDAHDASGVVMFLSLAVVIWKCKKTKPS